MGPLGAREEPEVIRGSSRRAAVRHAGAVAAGTVLAAGGAGTAAAHHSYPATYDTAQRVTVSGVVQLVRFANPHVHIVIETPLDEPAAGAPPEGELTLPILQEAPDAAPPTTLWVLDLPGPGRARVLGLTPEALPAGTPLTVVAWPPRAAGSHDLAPLTITFDVDGHTVRIR
jgi:hypothetical protein